MTHVVVSIHADRPTPTRLVGNVTKSKDGTINIEYAEPGQVKKTNKSFLASEVVGALAGEAGYVIAMLNAPVTKITGERITKDGTRYVKTENGTVALNNMPGVSYDVKEVEADSKEARAAERASKVKVRGARAAASAKSAKASGKPSRAERKAAKAEGGKKAAAAPSREERIAAKKAGKSKAAAVEKSAKRKNRG